MESPLNFYLVIFSLYLFLETLATYLVKRWVDTSQVKYLIPGLVIYFTCTCIWCAVLYVAKDLSKTSVIWAVLATVSTVALGYFYFQEKLNAVNLVGIILGCISIPLVSYKP